MVNNKMNEKLTKDYESNIKEKIENNNLESECKGLTEEQKEMDKFWNFEYSNGNE
ncbi:hypothetical protein [Caproiciproducens sp. MSJ-32]|uniref:hypothetical protein n=1 Tax=Caproiciproducens sp. MSJ-32 TaxID=2841527 RepID=UPI001C0FF984|nr:hypothetical protein [Caproiciproducens sp. MSJ-32]MBU5454228.1 hypothetical protein [Caproiciproducens sp. MSJ-32]